ncbi:MAG: hypothetical protein JXR81_06620 [Candidatus Goldbacteria bacterium]|nr:hypothetical protein [Candidatus Goldiibacteriota bacterium]
MRRILILAACIIISTSVFADSYYDGGAARISSLGDQSTAIPGQSRMNDSYYAGYVSSLLNRPVQNIFAVDFGWETHLIDKKELYAETLIYTGDIGIVYWFDKDTVVSVKPYAGFPYREKYLGGAVEIARRIIGRLSAGLSGAYYFVDDTQMHQNVGKSFYHASLSLLPEDKTDWLFSLAVGNKTAVSYSYNDVLSTQTLNDETLRLSFAVSKTAPEDIEFLFNIGAGFGYAEYRENWFDGTYEKIIFDDTLLLDVKSVLKKNLGIFNVGIDGQYNLYSDKNGAKKTTYSISAGASVKVPGNILIPAEFNYWGSNKNNFYYNQGYNLKTDCYTGKLGLEWAATEKLTFRTGVGYAIQSDEYYNIDDELIDYISEGEANTGILNINFGAGYKLDYGDINIAVKHISYYYLLEENLSDWETIMVVVDSKWYF